MVSDSSTRPRATRRRRGEPRRLLLAAAQELFAERGYNDTSTRQIAEHAGVSEPLLFNYFGSKVGLFRQAVVLPFVEFVESFNAKWQAGVTSELDDEAIIRNFLGDLFDLFRKNRALVVMLWAGDAQNGNELAESGVFDEVLTELRRLTDLRIQDAIRRQRKPAVRSDLATRSTVAMVAGMAVFGEAFYGKRRPSRKAIIEELVQATRFGHLHRPSK